MSISLLATTNALATLVQFPQTCYRLLLTLAIFAAGPSLIKCLFTTWCYEEVHYGPVLLVQKLLYMCRLGRSSQAQWQQLRRALFPSLLFTWCHLHQCRAGRKLQPS